MSHFVLRATEYAHLLLSQAVHEGDVVLDGTAGNGWDTCFLAALVGQTGRVYAFDIQPQACVATRQRLEKQGLSERVTVITDNHANLLAYHLPELAAAIFNLGWLPQSDHQVVTEARTTVQALSATLTGLKPGGILVVVAYPGHTEGAVEYEMIHRWLAQLPQGTADVLEIRFPHKKQAPIVLLIEKGY